MRWTRTANAGGLLEADGRRVLLDGVCQGLDGYEGTPPGLLERLLETKLDLIAFTHSHRDHFLAPFVRCYLRRWPGTPVAGPADLVQALAPYPVTEEPVNLGDLQIRPVATRHIGAAFRTVPHFSFVLRTSGACLWFTGDAAPTQRVSPEALPRPDVLLAPFAYAATEAGWRAAELTGAKELVLLHMPRRVKDPAGLWPAVEAVLSRRDTISVRIPAMGETLLL